MSEFSRLIIFSRYNELSKMSETNSLFLARIQMLRKPRFLKKESGSSKNKNKISMPVFIINLLEYKQSIKIFCRLEDFKNI